MLNKAGIYRIRFQVAAEDFVIIRVCVRRMRLGDRPAKATCIDIEIVRNPKDQIGFASGTPANMALVLIGPMPGTVSSLAPPAPHGNAFASELRGALICLLNATS